MKKIHKIDIYHHNIIKKSVFWKQMNVYFSRFKEHTHNYLLNTHFMDKNKEKRKTEYLLILLN